MLYRVSIDFKKLSLVNLRQPKFELHVKLLYSIIYLVIVRALSCTAIFLKITPMLGSAMVLAPL